RKKPLIKIQRVTILVIALFFFGITAFAQQQTVTGKITDATTGEALPGVNIVIMGTTTGTVSDVDGNYRLNVNNAQSDVLVFRFIGFTEQEIPVNGRSAINVEMETTSFGIEEVVAIGYGTVQRRDITGSVASVTGEALQAVPVSSPIEALTGKLAGV